MGHAPLQEGRVQDVGSMYVCLYVAQKVLQDIWHLCLLAALEALPEPSCRPQPVLGGAWAGAAHAAAHAYPAQVLK